MNDQSQDKLLKRLDELSHESSNSPSSPNKQHGSLYQYRYWILMLFFAMLICGSVLTVMNHTSSFNEAKASIIVKRDFNKKTTNLTKAANEQDMRALINYAKRVDNSSKADYYRQLGKAGLIAVQDRQRHDYLKDPTTGKYATTLTTKRLTNDYETLDKDNLVSKRLPDYYNQSYWSYLDILPQTRAVEYLHGYNKYVFTSHGRVRKNVAIPFVEQLIGYHAHFKDKFQQSQDDYNRLTMAKKVLTKRLEKQAKKEAKKRKKAAAKKRQEESLKASLKAIQDSQQREQDAKTKALAESIKAQQKQQTSDTQNSQAVTSSTRDTSADNDVDTPSTTIATNGEAKATANSTSAKSSSSASHSSLPDPASMSADLSSLLNQDNNHQQGDDN